MVHASVIPEAGQSGKETDLILPGMAMVAGFAFLIWGADRFIHGAAGLARNLGVPPIIIGLTVISFCTSAPEMLISAFAAASGNRDMGIGNAIGSNIANIGLVLGVTAMVLPIGVRSETLRREIPVLFVIMLGALILMLDGSLSRLDGLMLLLGLVLMLGWLTHLGIRARADALSREVAQAIPETLGLAMSVMWLLLGIAVLLLSSRAVVWGAVEVARWFGVSDLVIGLSILAIGTSLPELVASVAGVLKGEPDLALGNVIGSNMFNTLAVMSMPALIRPGAFADTVLFRDVPVMFGFTIALLVFAMGPDGRGRIGRLEGGALAGGYAGYLFLLYMQS